MASHLTSAVSPKSVNSFSKFHSNRPTSKRPLCSGPVSLTLANLTLNLLSVTAVVATLLFTLIPAPSALENGLARTPPMGWMSWERFACEIDCQTYPANCIGETLFRETAEILANEGYRDAGYVYINIDDCWSEWQRDKKTHKLVPNAERFPNGMEKLSSYIHSLGLKFGIYSDIGTKTCAGYPGHLNANGSNYFELDAETFASWGVDSLKVDGCYANSSDYKILYPKLGQALNSTG